nr:hypothetical protein [Tanacetum cinerariifolium]
MLGLKDFLSDVEVTAAGYGFYWCQVSNKDKTVLGYKAASHAVEGFVNSSKILEKQENKSDKGYHEVPPPFTGNYIPSKCDLRLIDEHFETKRNLTLLRRTSLVHQLLRIRCLKSLTLQLKIGTSSRRSLGEEDASKQERILKYGKQRSIFEERDFDVQSMMDADYELAARLRAEEQR